MDNTRLAGTGVAIITPFTSTHDVDYTKLEQLVDFWIKEKVDYLVVLGTTGESVTLDKEEKKEIVNRVIVRAAGRVPIVVGAGGNNTREILKSMESMEIKGIDALLSVVPYYNKPTQTGLYAHYKAISEASPLPVILYNVPGRTGINMTAETTLKLAHEFPNLAGIKEACGNLEQVMQIIKYKPSGFKVISGDDALTLPMIALGADGVISVIANAFPRGFSEMVRAALGGDFARARTLHYQYTELIAGCFAEGSPAGVKALLKIQGMIEDRVRLPLVPVSETHLNKLKELVNANL
jgi:4-hydroxy-tetrahydrodipicolinate synthase